MRVMITAMAFLALSGAAAAQQLERAAAITITENATAVLDLDPSDGTIAIVSSGRAEPINETELRLLRGAVVPSAPTQNVTTFSAPASTVIEPNRLRVSLRRVENKMLLRVENGYDQGFTYRAVIHRGGNDELTDVCLVRPGGFTYEHWPYAFESIEIAQMHLQPWKDGDPIPCA